MPELQNYKVIEAFEIDEVVQEVGSEVALTKEQAAEFGSKVELVVPEEEKEEAAV